jgi:hypothetical protein
MAKRRAKSTAAPTRKQQIRARQAAERQRRRIRAIALAGGAWALIALLASWSVISAANRPGEPVRSMGNDHIPEGSRSPAAYNSTPPTSGPHYGSLARWGVHSEPIPDELLVHNLEDGGVGVWYNCPHGCPDLVEQLESVVEPYHEGVLLAPYPGMDTRIALTAWTRLDRFDGFDQERVQRFIRAFRGADHHAQ